MSVEAVALETVAAALGAGIVVCCILLLIAVAGAGAKRARATSAASIRPALDEALVNYMAGRGDDSVFRAVGAADRTALADSILLFQGTVGGSARDRLCQLTLDLGFVAEWCADARSADVSRRRSAISRLAFAHTYEACRRVAGKTLPAALQDPDQEVRLSACRGLVQAGDESEIERVFAIALRQDLLARVVLTEDLRRYAQTLSAGPARRALRSGDPRMERAALEILVAWERDIPLEELREFLEHRDREIRLLAFRLAAFVTVSFESRLALIRALQDPDAAIRELAIIAIGRQKMVDAVPELALCLRREDIELARCAAEALAGMPPHGWEALEEFAAGGKPVTSLAAREALARARKAQPRTDGADE